MAADERVFNAAANGVAVGAPWAPRAPRLKLAGFVAVLVVMVGRFRLQL